MQPKQNKKLFLPILLLFSLFLYGANCGGSGGDGDSSDSGGGPNSSLALSLPINADEVVFTGSEQSGIWPYGAQGGDHPFGHPGIDFDCLQNTPILAAADGVVQGVYDSYYPNELSITLVHGVAFQTYYTGFFTKTLVTKGQKVMRGDPLALADYFLGQGSAASFHLGLSTIPDNDYECPGDYFTPEALKELQDLLDRSNYPDKDKFPNICNPCPEGGCR